MVATGEAGTWAQEGGEPEGWFRLGGQALLLRVLEGVGGREVPSLCAGTELKKREAVPAPQLIGTLWGRGCGPLAKTHPFRGRSQTLAALRPDSGGAGRVSGPTL